MTLSGWFKGEVDSRWHLVPISDRTHSNIPFRLWMERIMHQRVNHGCSDQYRRTGKVRKVRSNISNPGDPSVGDQLQACPRCNRTIGFQSVAFSQKRRHRGDHPTEG